MSSRSSIAWCVLLLAGIPAASLAQTAGMRAGLDTMIRIRVDRLAEGETYARSLRARFDTLQRVLGQDRRAVELSAAALRLVRVELKLVADRWKLAEYRLWAELVRSDSTALRGDTNPVARARLDTSRQQTLMEGAAVFARWERWIVIARHRRAFDRLRADLGKEV
jgi:hypothetical protein